MFGRIYMFNKLNKRKESKSEETRNWGVKIVSIANFSAYPPIAMYPPWHLYVPPPWYVSDTPVVSLYCLHSITDERCCIEDAALLMNDVDPRFEWSSFKFIPDTF
jgi:hypothetical protein